MAFIEIELFNGIALAESIGIVYRLLSIIDRKSNISRMRCLILIAGNHLLNCHCGQSHLQNGMFAMIAWLAAIRKMVDCNACFKLHNVIRFIGSNCIIIHNFIEKSN